MHMTPALKIALLQLHNDQKAMHIKLSSCLSAARTEDVISRDELNQLREYLNLLGSIRQLVTDQAVPVPTEPAKQAASELDIVSIQVQTTRLTGAGVETVSFKEQHNLPTHWSIYKRLRNGQAVWIEDLPLGGGRSDTVYAQVMVKAAQYSQMYQAFIETPF